MTLKHHRETPLVAALCTELAKRIPCSAATRKHLRAMPLREIIPVYLNYALRLVPPRQRLIVPLDGFAEFTRSVDQEHLVKVLIEIKKGDDLSARLSDKVRTHGFVRPVVRNGIARRQWEDKDLALNAWRIHHLHLGPRSKAGTVRRSDDLLYAHFRRDQVFLIACGPHLYFNEEIVRMGSRLRAATDDVLKGVASPSNFSHREQLQLARSGVSTLDEVEGQVVIGASLVTNGYGAHTMRYAQKLCRSIAYVEERLSDAAFVAALFDLSVSEMPAEPEFSWDLEYTDLVLVEHITRRKRLIVSGPL